MTLKHCDIEIKYGPVAPVKHYYRQTLKNRQMQIINILI